MTVANDNEIKVGPFVVLGGSALDDRREVLKHLEAVQWNYPEITENPIWRKLYDEHLTAVLQIEKDYEVAQ